MVERNKRHSTKSIDYGKEQEFSDDDIFEDKESQDNSPPPIPSRHRRRRPPDDKIIGDNDDFGAPSEDKYRFVEKGYDPSLPHLRERFTFMPEIEADGSNKVELIVGRRLIKDSRSEEKNGSDGESQSGSAVQKDSDESEEESGGHRKRRPRGQEESKKKKRDSKTSQEEKYHGEYEYLIKYRGKSYLHLEWKAASELESMNKSAKTLYRRYLKKLAVGNDDELEDPDVDPSYIQPQRIVDDEEHEIIVELSDKELVEWEKQQALENDESESEEEEETQPPAIGQENVAPNGTGFPEPKLPVESAKDPEKDSDEEEIGEPGTLSKEEILRILNRENPYYPKVEGSDNPYRDGYITEPPKKPRASYLFFQGVYRSVYQRRNKGASVGEVMTLLGDTWRAMSEEQQLPFIELASEEVAEYEKQKVLLEKAQRPNGLWQPLRRCRMIVDRLTKDSFCDLFQEPVSIADFPDYLEYVDTPMDLSTVRKKLSTRKYQGPENFARDMRKIWNNCKVYNQHGSQIWHVADYLSKQFERLYAAWVISFRDKYLRWANPKARPWESTCRICEGKRESDDQAMVLCDHCDSVYAMSCLKPPLTQLPEGAWYCPECSRKKKKDPSARMLSSVSEQAARKRAELGDIPKKTVPQRKYLVKWVGLGYEHCSWETKEDINDDTLIIAYENENNMTPDEPDVTEEEVDQFLDNVEHLNVQNAGGTNDIPDLRCKLYSQTRAFHFARFGRTPPSKVSQECGPHTKSLGSDWTQEDKMKDFKLPKPMPPLLIGEYDAVVPITPQGLLMNVGEINDSVAFLGYRKFPDGTKGPAEIQRLIKNEGDKIIAVDGTSTVNKRFKDVILLLKESGKNKFAHMRFLSKKYASCDGEMTSMGKIGRFTVAEANKQFRSDRRRLLIKRRLLRENDKEEPPEQDVAESDGSADDDSGSSDSDEEVSVEEFDQVSDDEDLVIRQKARMHLAAKELGSDSIRMSPNEGNVMQSASNVIGERGLEEEKKSGDSPMEVPSNAKNLDNPLNNLKNESNAVTGHLSSLTEESSSESKVTVCQETTQSLATKLLDFDIGYSSDEGGDEDCTYFLDGVDDTFTTKGVVVEKSVLKTDERKDDKSKTDDKDEENVVTFPSKKNEFASLGDRAKTTACILLTDKEPDLDDFDNYPLPSAKTIAVMKKAEEAREKTLLSQQLEEQGGKEETSEKLKLSTTKIEQLSVSSNEVIRVWASVADAAGTLQISLPDLNQLLSGVYSEDIGDEIGGYRWKYAAVDAEVTKIATAIKENDKGKKAFLEFREKLYDHKKPHNYKNGNRLRDYQIDGVNWLASCWYKNHSCILADEMGLGKTVQIVSYIEHLNRIEKIQRPFLVVVPLSTVEHWRREFEGWTDLRTCVYHDRQRIWRDIMREYEWYFYDRPHTPDFLKFDVLVTTYDTLIGDFDVIGQIPWRVTVVDEAHRLRNQKGKLLECMKEISARGTLQHGYQSRVLMTGTPLQNNIQELWTLLNFIEPYKFPSLEEFDAHYGNMGSRDQVERLQQKISPFMLRRVKEDVAKDIPAKEETLIDVELTSIQKQYYRAIFEHNHSFLNMGGTRNTAPKLMNIQMELRKCCNHPFLLDGVEQRETEKQHRELLESGKLDGKTPEEIQQMLNIGGYIQSSGKMVLLDKLLPKLRREGHKVLIFSQMVKMLDLLAEYCDFQGFKHERLDGRVRGNERQKAIDRFENEDDSFLFMLSTRAGGVGINLTAADICIIFDSDWNPQNDVQAQARCHRIGQTKSVMIYRLITSRSFEQEMFDRASKKLGLEQAVLGTFEKEDDGKPTAKEMEQLLKKGAYALLDNDEEMTKFCADDIEDILAKRTRTRVVEGTKTATWLNKQGMVTKSKFTSDSKSADLDMADPNFWEKVMPDFVTPSIMMIKLDELEGHATDSSKGGGKGRGRGRRKKADIEAEMKAQAKEKEDRNSAIDEGEGSETKPDDKAEKKDDVHITRTNQKKINKFIQDLKSMMDGVFEEMEDETLSDDDKTVCEKLLLTISVKEKFFTDAHRNMAKKMLKRLEGNRRRRCRNTGDEPARFKSSKFTREPEAAVVNENLMIRSSKKRRRKRQKAEDDDQSELTPSRKSGRKSNEDLDEDGYLQHSDSEADWSDVGDDVYESNKKMAISKKEARRRRAWASDKDAAVAAGLPWPSFPREKVVEVLKTLLDLVIKNDMSKGGIFSEPVPKDTFPEYYETIKTPMDYGTMQKKLERGEYRSALAMQKDLVLINSNCVKFNASDSDIVREARQQTLLRPSLLKKAALENNLFLAEDGSVIDVIPEEDGEGKKSNKKGVEKVKKKPGRKPKVKGKKQKIKLVRCGECDPCNKEDCGECDPCKDKKKFGGTGEKKQSCMHRNCENLQEVVVKPKRGRPPKKKVISNASDGSDTEKKSSDEASTKKPRIKISLKGKKETKAGIGRIPKKRKSAENDERPKGKDLSDGEVEELPEVKTRKRRRDEEDVSGHSLKKKKSSRKEVEDDILSDSTMEDGEMDSDTEEHDDPAGIYLNAEAIHNECEELDGTFISARALFTKRGPWSIPKKLREENFLEIATSTIDSICREDKYELFLEAVSEDTPDYSDIIENPMDFGTMKKKISDASYSSGSEGIAQVYGDFLLVMDNCALYNDDNKEILTEAGRLLGLLPKFFMKACVLMKGN